MYRCALTAVITAVALHASAFAQTHRFFPATALRGDLVVLQTPDVSLNGKPARLAPGARVKGDDNMLKQPASLMGQKLVVHYTVDPQGLLMDVWVLNPVELANKGWPRSREEAARLQFEPGTQTWSKP
ncbi:hypothetical protein [Pelomonas sp. SE-A7]|uniref:hypothetical protein n=1 Tax=Pelomonas sp. SE-A7 TaxID=3054953 RepID=UPI00259CD96E|nr:hypothetical protein [Pelomonas sp. SE-A7]MDM4767673.1 hypothetical protein [Pelomonas sp. SE-A7]